MPTYRNREAAGKILAEQLRAYQNKEDTIVLALPRGGVPVAYQIAKALYLPLDIFIVRKLGVPQHPELAFGAIAANQERVLNEEVIRDYGLSQQVIERVTQTEKIELERREKVYRGGRAPLDLHQKNIILVDDGIATGATLRAAIQALKQSSPRNIVVAVPVVAKEYAGKIAALVDEFVCPLQPISLSAVGEWYEDFSQTEDEEVFDLLKRAT